MYKNQINRLRKNFIKEYDNNDILKTILIGEKILKLHYDHNDTENIYYAEDAYNLACIYSSNKNFSKSTELYSEAANILLKAQGRKLEYSNILNNLAIDLNESGKYKESLKYFKETHEIRKEFLPKNHPDYINSLLNLGTAYMEINNPKQALEHHKQALNNRTVKDIDYVDNLNLIGYDYEQMQKLEESAEYLERGLNIIKRIKGNQSEEYLKNLYYLGFLYEKSRNYIEAKNCYEKSIELIKLSIGEEHPYYAEALNKLANSYLKCGNENKALTLRMKALNIIKKIVGENHIYYASNLKNTADIYLKKGDLKRAKKMYINSLNIKEKLLGKENEEYIKEYSSLAKIYIQEEDYETSTIILNECLKSKIEDKELIVSILLDLAYIYAKTYQISKLYSIYEKFAKIEPELNFDGMLQDIKEFEEILKKYLEQTGFAESDTKYFNNPGIFNNTDNNDDIEA